MILDLINNVKLALERLKNTELAEKVDMALKPSFSIC